MLRLYKHKTMVMKLIFYLVISLSLLIIGGCASTFRSAVPTSSATQLSTIDQTPSPQLEQTLFAPTISVEKTVTPTDLVLLNSLNTGEYLVLQGKDSNPQKSALYLFSSEGSYVGKLAEGHEFVYAALSPDHQWLAYVDGFDESSTVHIETLNQGEDFTLVRGCKYTSWSPDSQFLAVSCRDKGIVAFAYSVGTWKEVGTISIPSELIDLPVELMDSVQLDSPSWSPDGKSIAYFATSLSLTPEISVLGPYISSATCFFDKANCKTYTLEKGKIHPRPMLQWVQSSNLITVYSFTENQSKLYLFSPTIQNPAKIISIKNTGLIDSFAYSPSGQYLAIKPVSDYALILTTNNENPTKAIAPFDAVESRVLFWIEIAK